MKTIGKFLKSTPTRETGVVSIEFVGTLTILIGSVLIGMQLLLAGHTLSQANSAARNGARAESITTGTGELAAHNAVSSALKDKTVANCTRSIESARCSVSIQMPMLNIAFLSDWFTPMSVTREATMPITDTDF